eukprot:g82073.t1
MGMIAVTVSVSVSVLVSLVELDNFCFRECSGYEKLEHSATLKGVVISAALLERLSCKETAADLYRREFRKRENYN